MGMRLRNEQNVAKRNQMARLLLSSRGLYQPEYGDEMWECGMIGGIQQLSIDL